MGDEFLIGTIVPVPYNFIPAGAFLCNGQELLIAQYTALYVLVGNFYGSSTQTTFKLPNLQGYEPHPNIRYVIIAEGYFPERP